MQQSDGTMQDAELEPEEVPEQVLTEAEWAAGLREIELRIAAMSIEEIVRHIESFRPTGPGF